MLSLLGGFVSACGESSAPTPGQVTVSVVTTGDDPDPSYQIAVPNVAPYIIGPNSTIELGAFDAGEHEISLTDVAPNCLVQDNARRVTVRGGARTLVSFAVTCRAKAAALRITVVTTGPDQPATHAVAVQTVGTVAVQPNVSTPVGNLPPSTVLTVSLGALPVNCTVNGASSRTVTIPAVGSAVAELSVSCVPNVGTLRLTITTSGADVDADGYVLIQTGVPDRAHVPITYTNSTLVKPGERVLELVGIAENCAVQGTRTRTVNVLYAGAVDVSFDVACTATTGPYYTLAFQSQDISGTRAQICTVRSDGQQRRCHTAAEGFATNPTWLPDGSRIGYAAFGRIFTIGPSGDVLPVNFAVVSVPEARKYDADWSEDGARIVFRGGTDPEWSTNTGIYVTNAAGSNVTSAGYGGSPRFSPDGNRIVFTRNVPETGSVFSGKNIMSMDATGGDVKLLRFASFNASPSYSPDGTKILFITLNGTQWEMATMLADGSNFTRIPTSVQPLWARYSSDGSKIVFVGVVEGGRDIFIANADGSNVRRVTSNTTSSLPEFQPPSTTVF